MNLRNKKTGETGYYLHTHRDSKTGVLKVAVLKDGVPFSEFKPHEPIYDYDSLAGVNEDWKDYEPTEPLIKDEKIRKAVRAWAEANNVTKVWHEGKSVGFCDGAVSIKFHELCWEEIPKGEYTIAELCGEEEE